MYAVARRVDRMASLAAKGITVFGMDVTDDASMVSGIERIIAERGRIDVLVNNAGYGSYGAVEDVPIDEARRASSRSTSSGWPGSSSSSRRTCGGRAAGGSSTSPRSAR